MVRTVTLNCARLASRELAHTYLAGSLSLPDWYGRNLDALYDCLADMGPCALVLEDADSLRREGGYGGRILDAIDDAARANPGLTVAYRPAPMPTLFALDGEDYDPRWPAVIRPSVRAVILRGNKIALVHSLKYDYYKFPGGGVEPGEDRIAALVREVREEAALAVLPETVRPYGLVLRTEKDAGERVFIQDNYYYLCHTAPEALAQDLDGYEAEERFTPETVAPETAIAANRRPDHGPKSPLMILREARVLEKLIADGYLPAGGGI